MANMLKVMQRDNAEREQVLCPEDRETLTRMMLYLNASKISAFALEDIRHDLIGMAYQAEKRGESFAGALGMPEKDFCDELAQNAPRKTAGEWFSGTFISGLWIAVVVLLLWYATENRGATYVVTLNVVVHLLFWVPVGCFFISWATKRNLYAGPWASRAGLAARLLLLAAYAVAMVLIGRVVLFSVPTVAVFLPLGVALVAAYLYRRHYDRKMMAQYKWSAV